MHIWVTAVAKKKTLHPQVLVVVGHKNRCWKPNFFLTERLSALNYVSTTPQIILLLPKIKLSEVIQVVYSYNTSTEKQRQKK